jgi:hypothetical protein
MAATTELESVAVVESLRPPSSGNACDSKFIYQAMIGGKNSVSITIPKVRLVGCVDNCEFGMYAAHVN